jgi:hypothetical protein
MLYNYRTAKQLALGTLYQAYNCDTGTIFYAENPVTTNFYFDVYFRTRLHVSAACSHLQAILVIKCKG